METITHNLIGIYIQILCFQFFFFPLNILFTIMFAYFSHIVLDVFNIITFHTPESHKDDKFWLYWHIITYSLAGVSIILFIIPFWLSIIAANIMDIWDWCIVRPLQRRKKRKNPESNWGDNLYIHGPVDWMRRNLFSWLPQRRYKKAGIIVEIIVIFIFSFLIILYYI